jgi:SecD/SecF fusion protein
VTIERDSAQALAALQNAERSFASDFVFPSSSEIGSQVAGKTKTMAAFAMLFSLIGIVLYIWFRFHKVAYGLAAVVALVHDVLITLGAVAVSYWLARYVPGMNYLGIEEFKISLPVVAAFLTLMGYSLNDTIVVFDRIREVRGKSPHLNASMLNLSINSTLSRTLLTSATTFLSIVILFYLGGEGIHAFSFTLIIGIIVGTYSSIFVASPILFWMSQRTEATPPGGKKRPAPRTT